MKKCIILLCFGFFEMCVIQAQTFKVEQNKINPIIQSCDNDLPKMSFTFHGIYISSYYTIIDSIILTPTVKHSNYILILSPITQEYGNDTLPCDGRSGKRLLVMLKYNKNGYFVDFVNENVVPRISEFQSDPFVKMVLRANGLNLELFTGSIIKCSYYYRFSYTHGEFYLNNVKYDCYKTDASETEKKIFKFNLLKKNKLSKIDIHHYLYEPKFE